MRDQMQAFGESLEDWYDVPSEHDFVERVSGWWSSFKAHGSTLGDNIKEKWDTMFQAHSQQQSESDKSMEMGQ